MANQAGNTSGFKKLAEGVTNLVGAAGTAAAVGAKATGGMAQGSAGAAGKAVSGSAGLVGSVINAAANVVRRFPKLSFLVGVYAGIKGIQHVVRKHKENKQEAMHAEQAASLQSHGMEQSTPTAGVQSQLSPEQEAFVREMQQKAAMQQDMMGQPAAAPSTWAQQISSERAQAAQAPTQKTR